LKEFIARLTWVDYLTAIALLRGCYVGYRSGFFSELLRIASYLITVIAAFQFRETVAQYLTLKSFLNYTTASVIALIALLAVVYGLMKLLTTLLLKLLKVSAGGFIQRLLGLAMGVCRWLVLLSLVFMLIDLSPLSLLKTDIHDRSVVGAKVSQIAPTVFDFLSRLSPQLTVSKKSL
jgi:membrane protein required for colicin V production